jgi:hypothetical protein
MLKAEIMYFYVTRSIGFIIVILVTWYFFRKDYGRSLKIVCILVTGGYIYAVCDEFPVRNVKADYTNLAEFFEYARKTKWLPQVYSAFAKHKTTLNSDPFTKSRVLLNIEDGEKVALLGNRKDGWFLVMVRGKKGWIDGTHFRSSTTSEKFAGMYSTVNAALKYAFPEKTAEGKSLGVLLGLVIGFISNLFIKYVFKKKHHGMLISGLKGALPMGLYFNLKNPYLYGLDFQEICLAGLVSCFIAVMLSVPCELATNRILRGRFSLR